MKELLDFFKDLFLLKKEDSKLVGLTSLNKPKKTLPPKPKKKSEKELNLSGLMRRHKSKNLQGTIRPARTADYSQKSFR